MTGNSRGYIFDGHSEDRRRFLRFLAGSPYIASIGGVVAYLESSGHSQMTQMAPQAAEMLASPAEALNVLDFKVTARRKIRDGHWANMESGVDDDATLRANSEAYRQIQLRPRRLRDATNVDMRVELFGESFASPIFLCPTSGHLAYSSEGERGVARAARKYGNLMMLSTVASTAPEEVVRELGRPVWQQFYPPQAWDNAEKMLRRFQSTGTTVLVLTVDLSTGRNSETFLRMRPKDTSQCTTCHKSADGPAPAERPMYAGLNMEGLTRASSFPAMDWSFVDRLRNFWKGKLLLKGIDTHEDARLGVEHGVDGIIVSNHGGRATETLRASIECLPEVVVAVDGKIPVFVDGGIRRGTDAFKALALGAKAAGIGRPYLWGLGAFGQAGVERVIQILHGEFRLAMANCGTRTLADINRNYVSTPDWKI